LKLKGRQQKLMPKKHKPGAPFDMHVIGFIFIYPPSKKIKQNQKC